MKQFIGTFTIAISKNVGELALPSRNAKSAIWLGLIWAIALGMPISVQAKSCSELFKDLTEMSDDELVSKMYDSVKNIYRTVLPPDLEKAFAADTKHLSATEKTALWDYLHSGDLSASLRRQPDLNGQKPVPLIETIENMDRALASLHRFEGICFRGIGISREQLAALKIGDIMEDPGFMSASVQLDVAARFGGHPAGMTSQDLTDVFFVILSKSGRVVPNSVYPRYHPEWEILFPRNTRLKVLGTGYRRGRPLIFLREI